MTARGFTLLEVLVALAVLGLAVVASIQVFAHGLRLLRLSGEHQQAVLLADEKLREVTSPAEGRDEGTEGSFAWERSTKLLPRVDAPLDTAPVEQPDAWRMYQVSVRVRWGERQVEVATIRGMAPGEGVIER